MNRIEALVQHVNSSDGIILVDLEAENCPLSALLVEASALPAWLKTGNRIYVIFKESEVSLAKNLYGMISLRSRFPCKVISIEKGKLLSVIKLQFNGYTLQSAITSRSVVALDLKIGDEVMALVKANELTLMQK
jgi:molybdopterin-binding protein